MEIGGLTSEQAQEMLDIMNVQALLIALKLLIAFSFVVFLKTLGESLAAYVRLTLRNVFGVGVLCEVHYEGDIIRGTISKLGIWSVVLETCDPPGHLYIPTRDWSSKLIVKLKHNHDGSK